MSNDTVAPPPFAVSERDCELAEQWWLDNLEEPVTNEDFSALWILCSLFATARFEGARGPSSGYKPKWRAEGCAGELDPAQRRGSSAPLSREEEAVQQGPSASLPGLLLDLRGLSGFDHVGQTAIRAAEEIERLQAALALLKKIEDALCESAVLMSRCGWGPLYQEVADFLDAAT